MITPSGEYQIAHPPVFGGWGRSEDLILTSAASDKTLAVIDRAVQLRRTLTPSMLGATARRVETSVEERLYEALSDAKVYTSQVAMYMEREWRSKLFKQLDSLLDPEEWVEDDVPLRKASFATFLKVMFLIKPGKRPGLGLTSQGNLIGAWTEGDARLTIECMPNEAARWVVSHEIGGRIERAAGETAVTRLCAVLSPYDSNRWFKSGASS